MIEPGSELQCSAPPEPAQIFRPTETLPIVLTKLRHRLMTVRVRNAICLLTSSQGRNLIFVYIYRHIGRRTKPTKVLLRSHLARTFVFHCQTF